KRESFDRFGHVPGDGAGFAGGFGAGSPSQPAGASRPGREGASASGLKDLFELFRGSGRDTPERRGSDIHTTVDVSFEAAVKGVTARLLVRRQIGCTECQGSGGDKGFLRARCGECGGSGYVKKGGLFRSEQARCPACAGTGASASRICAACAGRGVKDAEETLSRRIPAG